MKKLSLFVAALLLGGAAFFVWAGIAGAQSFHTGPNVNLSQRKPIDKTVYAAGQTIDISSNVNGDVFCAGQTVTVSGDVRGDVICAGQTVTVTGHVYGDVRLAGQSVTVGGMVDGNATIGAQTFTLSSTASIEGDITVGGTDTTLNGTVGRNVVAGGETVAFSSSVDGDATVAATNVRLLSGAAIAGNLEYTSHNKLSASSDATVGGTTTKKTPQSDKPAAKNGAIFGFGVALFVYLLVAALFTAVVVALLFPQLLRTVTDQALMQPWKVLLVGFVATLVVPPLLILIALTVIGIPLAILLGIGWLFVVAVSGLFSAQYLGRLVMQRDAHLVLAMFIGAAILVLAAFVPILGFVAFLGSLWFGTGMILLELFRRTPKPAYETVPSTTKSKAKKS